MRRQEREEEKEERQAGALSRAMSKHKIFSSDGRSHERGGLARPHTQSSPLRV
jgi:hypothetical protein